MEFRSRRDILRLTAGTTATLLAGCNTSSGTQPAQSSTTQTTANGPSKEALRKTIDDLEGEVTKLEVQISKYDSTIKSQDRKIDSLKSDLTTKRRQLNQTNTELDTLKSELQDHEATIKSLKAELARHSNYQYSEAVRTKAQALGEQARRAVVVIDYELQSGYSSGGTGWFIDDHHIITNAHVLQPLQDDRASNASAYLLDGTQIDITARNLAPQARADVALATTTATAPHTLKTGSTDSLSDGQPLINIGHPGLIGNWVIGLGEFLGLKYNDTVTAEMPSTGGNSGSPILTLDGTVIGLHYASGTRPTTTTDSPQPVDPTVYEQFPYQAKTEALAESIETVQEYYTDWT